MRTASAVAESKMTVHGYNEDGYCPECANSGGDHHPNCTRRPRTLADALSRAENLRDFQKTNRASFEKSADWQDIVSLADEVQRLKGSRVDRLFNAVQPIERRK